MAEFVIPCETFARLSNALIGLAPETSRWFNTIRIDNGCAVVSNRHIMCVENIGNNPGIIHIVADPALIAKCREEATWKSMLTIIHVPELNYATAKTSFGYVHPVNVAFQSDEPNHFDRWRAIVDRVRTEAKPYGGMYWNSDHIAAIAAASPSGRLVFEEKIDAHSRPTLIRDIYELNWFAMFNPFTTTETYNPATLPTWMK